MTERITPRIRGVHCTDMPKLQALYPQAFPGEDLRALVQALADGPALAWVADCAGDVVGHVMFTPCGLSGGQPRAALLGPLAVRPDWQRRGIGGHLIRVGLDRCAQDGMALACVLGDPGYYSRHGFRAERGVATPYPLPDEWAGAWQSQPLGGRDHPGEGVLVVPPAWRDPVLWGP